MTPRELIEKWEWEADAIDCHQQHGTVEEIELNRKHAAELRAALSNPTKRDVRLSPATIIRKGCKLSTVLRALELDDPGAAMPEQPLATKTKVAIEEAAWRLIRSTFQWARNWIRYDDMLPGRYPTERLLREQKEQEREFVNYIVEIVSADLDAQHDEYRELLWRAVDRLETTGVAETMMRGTNNNQELANEIRKHLEGDSDEA